MQGKIIESKGMLTVEQRRNAGIIQRIEEQNSAGVDQLNLAHASEIRHLQQQIKDINARNKLVIAEMEAELAELKSLVAVYESRIENKSKELCKEREQYEMRIMTEREESEVRLTRERELLTKECE